MAETKAPITSREDIVRLIRGVSVGPGQTLRQVQVPENTYRIARSFLKWAPNESVGTGNSRVPLRYKVLHSIPPSDSIYTLLMKDAGLTPISAAKGKIEEWKEATKSLLRYALNLKLAPKRPEFLRMKLSSSYYVYQVQKKLQGADKILLCMGYEPVGSQSSELKYAGDVRMDLVIDTAVDLVVLHADLELIGGIVIGAQQAKYKNVTLFDILSARSEPNDTLTNTLDRSIRICFQRMTRSKPPPVVHTVHAPAIPPRAHQPPQFLDVKGDSAASRRSSAPNIQQEMSAPELHSPLLQVQGRSPDPHHKSMPSPNSKEDFNKVDKTLDKSGGVGKDSVDPKYPIIIARSPSGSRYKSGSTSFDPDKLPEPAFDTHDLEMFHQEEAHGPDDSIMSGHISMFIDARSTEFDDFSGPNLDDHLSFRSHDSGHEGLPGIRQSNISAAAEYDDDRCVSGINASAIHGIIPQVSRAEEALYEELSGSREKEEPEPAVSFDVGHESSTVSKPPPKSMNEIESPSSPMPKPRPRSYSGGKKQPDVPKADKKLQPMPRPMSHQNLLSTKNPTPPRSPQHGKPVAAPRRKKVSPSNTPVVREPETQATSETLPSIDNNEDINTSSTLPSLNITSIHTTGLSLQCDTINDHLEPESLQHSEAHTSHESDSPHPSLEQTPSMSSKSDPHSGSSHDNASSACFSEKVFTETNVEDSLGSWVQIEVENKESHSQPSSLGSAPIRKRADAFSARPDKTVDKKPATPDVSEICYDPRLVQLSHDIQNATPCWYCMNLTTDRICDICGNEQKQNKETMV